MQLPPLPLHRNPFPILYPLKGLLRSRRRVCSLPIPDSVASQSAEINCPWRSNFAFISHGVGQSVSDCMQGDQQSAAALGFRSCQLISLLRSFVANVYSVFVYYFFVLQTAFVANWEYRIALAHPFMHSPLHLVSWCVDKSETSPPCHFTFFFPRQRFAFSGSCCVWTIKINPINPRVILMS